METNKPFIQMLKKGVNDDYVMAEKYYAILSVVNDLHLTQRETQLVAFTAVRGNMSYANVREEFCRRHETTTPTINNIISRLKRIGMLVKENGRIKVNPRIAPSFDGDIVIMAKLIRLKNG